MTQNQSSLNIQCNLQKEMVPTNQIRKENDYELDGIFTTCLLPNGKLRKSMIVKMPDAKFGENNSLKSATFDELLNVDTILRSGGQYTNFYFPVKQNLTSNHNGDSLIQKINLKDVATILQPLEQKFGSCVRLRMFGIRIIEICSITMFSSCTVINIDRNNYNNYNGYNVNGYRNYCEHFMHICQIKDNAIVSLIDTQSQLRDKHISLNSYGETFQNENVIYSGNMIANKFSNDSNLTGYTMLLEPTNTTANYPRKISNTSITNNSNINTIKESTVMNHWQNFLWSKLRVLLLYVKVI